MLDGKDGVGLCSHAFVFPACKSVFKTWIFEPEKGLEEIGDQLGLTRERVRQIREKSIAKLRDSGNAKILMKYLG